MTKHSKGRIEVICGSMFSGKTEELIRRLRRAQIARQQVQVFKPVIDNRYHAEKVMSHNGADFQAQPVASSFRILRTLEAHTTEVTADRHANRLATCADSEARAPIISCCMSTPTYASAGSTLWRCAMNSVISADTLVMIDGLAAFT